MKQREERDFASVESRDDGGVNVATANATSRVACSGIDVEIYISDREIAYSGSPLGCSIFA